MEPWKVRLDLAVTAKGIRTYAVAHGPKALDVTNGDRQQAIRQGLGGKIGNGNNFINGRSSESAPFGCVQNDSRCDLHYPLVKASALNNGKGPRTERCRDDIAGSTNDMQLLQMGQQDSYNRTEAAIPPNVVHAMPTYVPTVKGDSISSPGETAIINRTTWHRHVLQSIESRTDHTPIVAPRKRPAEQPRIELGELLKRMRQ